MTPLTLMETKTKPIKPVRAKAGQPLYTTVKQAMVQAIHTGVFKPAEKLPSTKQLSEQFQVSLVTTHRALQELESTGMISRVQGRGTFVSQNPKVPRRAHRISVGLQHGLALSDFYHSQLIEGLNNAAHQAGSHIAIIRAETKPPADAEGYIAINPPKDQLAALAKVAKEGLPVVVLGVSGYAGLVCVDVDNANLMERAVRHLAGLGHQRIGYLGGAGDMAYRVARRDGYRQTMRTLGLQAQDSWMCLTPNWRLDDQDKLQLMRCLTQQQAPTAMIAAGYYYALGVYETIGTLGLQMPDRLSLVSVDDPPSAAHLNPPLTALRQPVEQLGHTAMEQLLRLVEYRDPVKTNPQTPAPASHLLRGDLIVRDSTSPPSA